MAVNSQEDFREIRELTRGDYEYAICPDNQMDWPASWERYSDQQRHREVELVERAKQEERKRLKEIQVVPLYLCEECRRTVSQQHPYKIDERDAGVCVTLRMCNSCYKLNSTTFK